MTKKKTKTRKSGAGRPTLKTDNTVRKLEQAFRDDFTVGEACRYAGISTTAYYEWQEKDKVFMDKMTRAQDYVAILAKKGMAKLVKGEDPDSIKWWLSRRQRDRYATKNEQTHSVPEPLTPEDDAEIEQGLNNSGIK